MYALETIFFNNLHKLFASGGDQSTFQNYGALADQNLLDKLALKVGTSLFK